MNSQETFLAKNNVIPEFENLFWQIYKGSNTPMLLVKNYMIIECNTSVEQLFKSDRKKMLGKMPYELAPQYQPDGRLSVEIGPELYNKIIEKGNFYFEWVHKKEDGEEFLANISGSSFYSKGILYAIVGIRDITFIRKNEIELENYRKHLEELVKEKTDLLNNNNHELIALNEELDTANEELSASNEELSSINEELNNANQALQNEIEEHKKTQIQLESYKNMLEVLLQEKTERLAQISERFNEVYTNSFDAITFMDILDEGNTVKVFDMNPAAQNLLNVTRRELAQGLLTEEFTSDKSMGIFKSEYLPQLLSGQTVTFSQKDNNNNHWSTTVYPIQNNEGKVYRIVAYSRNINAEYEKEQARAFLNSAIESWPYEFWITDTEGRCIIQNKASLDLWGNLYGKKIDTLDIPKENRQKTINAIQKGLNGEHSSEEYVFDTPGGKRYVLFNIHPIYQSNNITGILGMGIDITNLKVAEEKIRLSEANYRLLAENIEDVIWEMDINTMRYTFITPSIYKLTGFTVEESLAQTLEEMVTPESLKYAKTEMTERIKQYYLGDLQSITRKNELELRCKNGGSVWVEINSTLMTDRSGKLKEIFASSRNITERKIAEKALRESEEKFRISYERAGLGFALFDINGKILNTNAKLQEFLGRSNAELINTNTRDYVHPEDVDIDSDLHAQLLKGTINSYQIEKRYLKKDGSVLYGNKTVSIVRNSDGDILHCISLLEDITKRKMAELALRESEERYSLVTRLSGYIVFDVDIQTRKIYWAGATEEVIGYSIKELNEMGSSVFFDFIHPEDRARIREKDLLTREALKPYKNKYRFITRNRGVIWIETVSFIFNDIYDKPIRWLGILRDITEQLRIESAITESEEKLRSIFNTANDGIILLDNQLNILDINRAAYIKTGYTYEELIQNPILNILSEQGLEIVQLQIKALKAGEAVHNFETEIIIKNNEFIPVEVTATDININGQDAILIVARDISERKKLERELLHSVIDTEEKDRLHFSQELHDGIGPLLSAAKMYAEWLAEPNSSFDAKTIIPDLRRLIDESTESVRDLSFRLSPHILQNYGIVEALKAYADKVNKLGKVNISINVANLGRFDELIEATAYRIVCECINNSLKHAQAGNIVIQPCLEDNTLIIKYSDDGKGFDPDVAIENRKGLGILNMQSRLKSLNGSLTIISTKGAGAAFLVKIPVNQK